MNELDDELDLRYHRGLKPEVYYRCPSSETLDGAIRNELEKNAQSLIPVEIVTEFVFTIASTITIPVIHQPNLEALFQPADFAQSITVDQALCRSIEGKDRLKAQRAIARSFIEAIQGADGFKYSERQAYTNKDGTEGTRFKYVCADSLQNRDRKRNIKKEKNGENADGEQQPKKRNPAELRTYDCGGAIHIKFSIKREAINVIYKHNPIHRDVSTRALNDQNGDSQLPALVTGQTEGTVSATNGSVPQKRKRSKKDDAGQEDPFHDLNLDMSTSPEASKTPSKKKGKKKKTVISPEAPKSSTTKKAKKGKEPQSPSKSRKKAPPKDASPPAKSVRGKACLRCREKKIKCNEAKPTCNQCARGLWTCQYETDAPKKRSKNGCINCRQRKRKCTEERPSCAYCLKVDDDCMYTDEV
ncbi:hypothetical protein BDV95DRAFT_604099 [Massariosphaeria phaeospora]|uniref:Zn(2)-C6 fungal-type domain-containing protein n=1 Tax=Massariosphaeria phaeospora TaxID=100035 RepID=A0A7C8MRJ6_9PLEO|nr:hypothetical protein BDV95DRAFT_604099 [Massariosphaeria phaeospora]